MRWLVRALKSRTFLISLGFMLLIALVLVLGAWLAWRWELRLLGIIIVLMLGLGTLALVFLRENRSADAIERSIKQQAEQQRVSTRPDKQGEIQELQTQLERAIEQLKQSKLGRGQRGRAALYALPWYLFIGPPGAGKTTAIANSGLNFPLGSDRTRGVGGTRNCDWFFSDTAILLDTAGRYMTEQEDAEEWLAFLDTLKQHRTERPINGVIVGIALASDKPGEFVLASARPDDLERHADAIRRRADELVQRLGVRLPVYLVFTKCDMLQGFVEFFGEMTRREREQIWGCTFDEKQQASSNLRAVFEEEFDRLTGTLVNRRSARLSRPMKREQRQKVYAFPLQLASVKDNLARFVGRLFQPNPYQENPIFRGFYFTSGTQEGVPLDQVIQAIARQFELATTGETLSEPMEEAKSYFIRDFFTDVVIPDQYMVRRTSKASRTGSVRRVGVMVAAAVLLGLFVLGTSQALVRGKMSLNEVREAAASVGVVRWDDRAAALDNLARVGGLGQEVERLDASPLLGLGLYRNGTVQAPSRRLFLDHARAFVRAYPLQELERRMRLATRQAQVQDTAREALTADLKAYLLLTHFEEASARLDEEGNRNFLIRYLTDLAADDLEPQAAGMTRGELRARIETPVTAYVEALREDVTLAMASDGNLVQGARRRIDEPISERVLYERLRLDGRGLRPFTLADVPGRYSHRLESSAEVSGFFTQRGWETFVRDKIDAVSQDPTGEDWVMGRTGERASVNLGSQQEVAAKLEDLYFSDYAAAWLNFLRSVQVRPFEDLRDAGRGLGELSDANDSPIAYLLAYVTNETFFEDVLGEQLEGVADAVRQRAENRVQRRTGVRIRTGEGDEEGEHPVNQRLRWLHALQADQFQSGGASGDFYQAIDALREAGLQLDGLTGDALQAAEFAGDVLDNDGGDLERQVRVISNALSTFNAEARRHLFEAPVEQAWQAVLATAQTYLSERWREVVYEPFQRSLASLYPFDPNSLLDAPLFDVEAFFNPQSGAVPTFIDEELTPFIGRDLDRPATWKGRGIALSPSAREAVGRAQRIGSDAFTGGRLQVAFELQPEQPEKTVNAPAVDQVSIRLLGKEDTYRLGFQRWTAFEWPGGADAMLSVSTQVGDLPPQRYDGDWALFRMLQQARITPRTQAEFELRWVFERPGQYTITARYNLRTQRASNPFSDPRGFFTFRPPSSLN